MNGGGTEWEGDTESEAVSRLWTISPEPDAELELMEPEIVTWAEVGHSTYRATQAPLHVLLLKFVLLDIKSSFYGLVPHKLAYYPNEKFLCSPIVFLVGLMFLICHFNLFQTIYTVEKKPGESIMQLSFSQ